MKTRRFVAVLVIGLVAFAWSVALAQPDDPATCAVSVTVANIMEWEDNFTAIDLGTISSQAAVVTGLSTQTLYTNGDCTISADNTVTAELDEAGGDTLVTEYRLEYDGDGAGATGGSTVDWTAYNLFLGTASSVTHVSLDGNVEVTLNARASNATGTLGNAGAYSA
ncbi:unnamed protein product, partial [marine sediment metagenome]